MEKHENVSWMYQQELKDPFKKYLNNTDDYLALLCGPRRSHLFLPVTAVYALIFVVGVVGNLLVCLVILRHQTMKTPTNYYLFSLAVSDLLVLLLGMPLEVYEMWRNYPFLFGPVGCYFKTALFETVCFASILSVTTVSVERYVAVLHPFRAKLKSTRGRALRILGIVWGLSVLFSLPNTSIHGIKLHYFPNGSIIPGSATCTVIKPMWIYNFIIQVTSLLFYILPMTVISVLYYLMGLKLKKDQHLEADKVTANIQRPSRKSVTKMLCVFFYLSSAVNPIIYNLLSHRFQAAFRTVIPPSCQQQHSHNHSPGPSMQRNIFLTECHLVELTEDVAPQFPRQLSVLSSQLPTALCTGQVPRKELAKS
ncbi:neuromedin-U receptor 2 isoform X1 [Bos indicus x Bos taurus]|uniref:neuromedin-U receptor 2 isoform X1 n=1 Tax=Bos indicus x Bos taurus TaxID=30522 RepID=UPI000383A8EF|nr:neuromedin-U receptor 2 isoform X1 [Bos indicus x Bos taurus]XP_061280094.1 neuromedin-U receptor 2 isoform X1 [Bos javanicus]